MPETITVPPAIARALAARGITPEAVAACQVPDPFQEQDHDREERVTTAARNRATRWTHRLPQDYVNADPRDLTPEQQHTIRRWLDDPAALTLVLAGKVGAGKTHAAYAIGNHLVAQGRWVEAWHVHDLLRDLRPNTDDRSRAQRMRDRAEGCHLLILDDLGAARTSEWAKDELGALIDARVRDRRRTVVTTNDRLEELAADLGDRTIDRLRHDSAGLVFTGPSRRKALTW